jgi:threonylcarbamoyladenosine tRNA methylthiotransferase MtaB
MQYAIVTFGCRVNQADSLHLEEQFLARGASEAPVSQADVVVVNTCSVTATADQGARQTIRRIARENPAARILVTGCYATRRPDEIAGLPNVVRVVGNDEKRKAVEWLEAAGELTTTTRFGEGEGPCGASIAPGLAGRTVFALRVQTGCEERCSYCIIPTTRGRGRSLPISDVVSEARRVAAAGFKEIALTGVHLGSYGRDLEPVSSLEALLRALGDLDVDVTFRISSLEPMDCTPAIVDLVASSGGRFAPHFHLPLQHASDRILRAMRRPYTLAFYSALIGWILERMPHASIGSDVIAGFPGETEADVEACLAYLPGSGLSHLHVFPYSDRPGTDASRMPRKVEGAVTRDRGAALRRIGADLASRFRRAQIGTVRPGLTLEDGTLVVTDNYLKLRIPAGLVRNQRVDVRVTGEGRGVVENLTNPDAAVEVGGERAARASHANGARRRSGARESV